LAGHTIARLMTFGWLAAFKKFDFIGGFHLLLNGLAAGFMSRVTFSKSLYFSVGGPAELIGGGIWGENKLFNRLKRADSNIERRLIRAVAGFDLIITMGKNAKNEFRKIGVHGPIHVNPGGIDIRCGTDFKEDKKYDVIFVGRLAPIKQVDIILQAMSYVQPMYPKLRVAIVGEGELRPSLVELTGSLGLSDVVEFTGFKEDVMSWLRISKVFIMASKSEGLPLSMIEAMMAGLPCVAPKVGEIEALIQHGQNGFLIESHDPKDYGEAVLKLLSNSEFYTVASERAMKSGQAMSVGDATAKWDRIFSEMNREQESV
jgi:glycosyltransferase involved in cell wall biosynthesis